MWCRYVWIDGLDGGLLRSFGVKQDWVRPSCADVVIVRLADDIMKLDT